MILVALYSPAPGSGKTTAAKYLEQRHSFQRLSFAAPLKAMLRPLLDHVLPAADEPNDYLTGDKKELPIPGLEPLTSRQLMATLGTGWGRTLDSDFWVKIMAARLSACSEAARIVIDDMRFPNEFDMVTRLGGLPVLVVRPGAQVLFEHASEGALKDAPFTVGLMNGGTVEELHEGLDAIVARVTAPPVASFYH